MNPDEVLDTLRQAVEERDYECVDTICREVAAELRLGGTWITERTAQKLLALLKAGRCFNELVILGAALSRAFPKDYRMRRLYVQGLVDSGQLDPALVVVEGMLESATVPHSERLEAWGLKGRIYKQSYVDSAAPPPRKTPLLQAALDAYAQGWEDSRRRWHGINLVALLVRAEMDGVALSTDYRMEDLAREILDSIEVKDEDEGDVNLWDAVTAMEAALALGESQAAIDWAERYVRKGLARDRGEFEFASTLRQLQEVWLVDLESEFGAAVLPLLEAVVLDRGLRREEGSGSVELESDFVASLRSPDTFDRLERVFGDDAFVTTRWLHILFDRLGAIGSVATKTGKGIGTGFVVPGAALSDRLDGEWYFVTNSHVVTDDEEVIARAPAHKKPARPEAARITFELLFEEAPEEFKVAEVVWTSPPEELDVTILRLDRPAYEGRIVPYPVSEHLAEPSTRARLYIAGHPGGGGLRISMHDNHLIDFDDRKIHYRTPTNPGSSGSPVFNDQWDLVGLHHAGSAEMPALDGSGEVIEANEGIRLGAILEGLREHLGRGAPP